MPINLHIAISTGQNIANLIPIREMGKKGDRVLLIESETARQRNYTAPLRQLLEESGFRVEFPLRVSDAEQVKIYPLAEKLKSWLHTHHQNDEPLFFYFNGGQKMAALGMQEAAQAFHATFVYQDHSSVQLIISNQTERQSQFTGIKNKVCLEEVLSLHQSQFHSKNNERRKWQPENIESFFWQQKYQMFQSDPELIAGILKTMIFAKENSENQQKFVIPEPVHKLARHYFEQYIVDYIQKNWPNMPFVRLLKNRPLPERRNGETRIKNTLKSIADHTFSQYPKLIQKYNAGELRVTCSRSEWEKLCQIGWLKRNSEPENIRQNDLQMQLGPFFEEAVYQRFFQFLQNHPEIKEIISEVWTNVKIEAIDNPGKISGEYDLLILLKNGILISLECKTFRFEEKDIFARIARLVRRTGLLNEQWVALMMFTDEELLHPENMNTFKTVKSLGIPIIPYGREGQPDFFVDGKEGKRYEVPTFEAALNKIFRKYISVK